MSLRHVSSTVDIYVVTWTLLILHVNSQTKCEPGWFGPKCNYKCRCQSDRCEASGACRDTYTCSVGWFGPACQYADVAFQGGTTSPLIDGNDTTCVQTAQNHQVSVRLLAPVVFTWLRALFKMPDVTDKLTVAFQHNNSAVGCSHSWTFSVDEYTLDLYCDPIDSVDELILSGQAAQYLCSVYVSGGRNVALKEIAQQDTTYFESFSHKGQGVIYFTPDKAVDGNRRQYFYDGFPCSMTTGRAIWRLWLSVPRLVHTYVIYTFRDISSGNLANFIRTNPLIGFRLESFDYMNTSVFVHTDNQTQGLTMYRVSHTPRTVQSIRIDGRNSWGFLPLCEVEVYGDSICTMGRFGPECNQTCICPASEYCFVGTGGCPSGCAMGFTGSGCQTRCAPGTYGAGCKKNCSQFCVKNTKGLSCMENGTCVRGCIDGYIGQQCRRKCFKETYGKDCASACSPTCQLPQNASASSCDNARGTCLYGCVGGYMGLLCEKEVFSYTKIGLYLGVSALIMAAMLAVVYCFYRIVRREAKGVDQPELNVAHSDVS